MRTRASPTVRIPISLGLFRSTTCLRHHDVFAIYIFFLKKKIRLLFLRTCMYHALAIYFVFSVRGKK